MPAESLWASLGVHVVLTLGIGAVSIFANSLILATAPRELAGAAASISETAVHLDSALGTAGCGTISAAYRQQMEDASTLDMPAAATESIGAAEAIAAEMPALPAVQLLEAATTACSASVGSVTLIAPAVLIVTALVTETLLHCIAAGTTAESDSPGDDE